MLAYVFWHAPKGGVEPLEYESGLLSFSHGLARSGCEGLRSANSFRISAVPWLDNGARYEDWAIVDGSGVLDTLNTAAVSGPMATLHARVAQSMEVGHGGLYYHLWGDAEPQAADAAQWLSRPRGIEFRPVLEQIAQSAEQPVSVWRRFMVLGPGLEFLVLGSHPLKLQIPPSWSAHSVRRSALGAAC